jgi:hypothetical protein
MSATLPMPVVPEAVLPPHLSRRLAKLAHRGHRHAGKILARLAHAPAADEIGPRVAKRVERVEAVPNAPLRFRYLALFGTDEEVTLGDLCRALDGAGFTGWLDHHPPRSKTTKRGTPDTKLETARISRALGLEGAAGKLRPTRYGRPADVLRFIDERLDRDDLNPDDDRYPATWRTTIGYDEALVIGARLGMDPHEFGA